MSIVTTLATERENPFLKPYNTLHGTVPFEEIENEDFLPAMKAGFKAQDEEIDAIVNNTESPTFENTIEALERSGKLLGNVQYVMYNLLSAESNETLQKIAQEISPEESEHSSKIMMNERLFARVKAVYENKKAGKITLKNVEQETLLQDTYDAFEASGATLEASKKERFREINKQLSALSLTFGQNVLNATNEYEMLLSSKEQLAGLPDDLVEAAKERASSKKKQGYLIDLSFPSYAPFLKYAQNRELRKQLYMAYNTKAYGGKYDNREIVKKVVNLRMEKAQLLGYKDYASYVLKHRMAESEENVYGLLNQLEVAYRPEAERELKEVQEFADKYNKENGLEQIFLQPWDWSFYSNKLKEAKYSVNDSLVKPYFELERVKEGVFGLATTLYGLQFKRNENIQVYHKDVEAYEVFDKDGKFKAVLYTDYHPRAGKQGGAWMTEYKQQCKTTDGKDERPHISLVMNFSRPIGDKPSLLTLDEVQTFLHEFGHSIHGMLANSTYASMAGTNVERDFVEMPSQIMENWAIQKEWLDKWARHYETGEKVPKKLVEKIKKSANFNCGYACLRQLSFGYLDMAWHTRTEMFDGDVEKEEKRAWHKALVLPDVDGTCMSVQFSHIFDGGYAAGYYGYKWAEVLDADAFSVFLKNGIFDKKTADCFRTNILERGGSEKPMVLYERFRGQKPTIDALLKRNGIKR